MREQLALGSYPPHPASPLPRVAWLSSGPPGWVSLGHLCWSTAPEPLRCNCQLNDFPVIQVVETDVGFPLHLVISVLTLQLQLTWLRLLRSPSCPFVPSCLLPHAIFIPTHTSSSTWTSFTLSCSMKLELGLLNLYSHLCKLEVWEVSSHFFCVILFSLADSFNRFLPPPVPCQCQFSPSSFKFPFPVEHCLVPAVVPIAPP